MIEYWSNISRKEIRRFKTALLPIGAIEQHGDHLPLGTDSFLASSVSSGLKNSADEIKTDVLILPVMEYGKSTEHISFPGTITLSVSTLISFLFDIADSLKSSGIETLIIINGHGGNTGIIDGISYDIHRKTGLDVYSFPLGKIFAEVHPRGGLPDSMHAGLAETSMLEYLHPEFSELYSRIPNEATDKESIERLKVLGSVSWGWKTEEISAAGFIGNPSDSNESIGQEIMNKTIQLIIKKINAICGGEKDAELL